MLWLVLRLHVESGAAKLLTGDPTWRDLTAMATYYETAPLPTWVGWYVHQMPLWAHKACSAFTFFVELWLPFWMWSRRSVRAVVFLLMLAMQVSIVLTGNYGFFNYLSAALCLFVLDDAHLAWVARRLPFVGARARAAAAAEGDHEHEPSHVTAGDSARAPNRAAAGSGALWLATLLLVPLSVVPFLNFVRPLAGLERELAPVRRVL